MSRVEEQPRTLFHADSYAALEAGLWRETQSTRTATPIAPIVVLVPTSLLRRHLLAQGALQGGILNVHFVTFHALAATLGGPALARAGRVPLSRPGRELIARAVSTATPADYYTALADRPGFHRALVATLDSLKEAALVPDDLAAAVSRAGASSPALASRLADLECLWRACDDHLAAHGLHDDADLLIAAAEAAPSDPWLGGAARFIVYGFYDLNPLQQRLVEACAAACPTCAFFPYAPDTPAFDYARPTFDWLTSLGFQPTPERARPEQLPAGLAALRQNLFAPPAGQDGSDGVRIVSAPNEASEVRAVIGAALAHARAGTPLTRVGVLLRHAAADAARVVDECESGGLAAYHHDPPPLSTTQAGKSLLLLLRLLDGDLARADVMEFLTSADVPFERLVSGDVSPADWDLLSAEAGVVRGRESWQGQLDAYRHLLESRAHFATPDPEQLRAMDGLVAFMELWLDAIEAIPVRGTWAELTDAVLDMFEEFVRESDERDAVSDAVRTLRDLDATGEPADLATLRRLARETLDQRRSDTHGFGSRGPVVVDLLEGRGLPFDVVCVPGMVEKQFPAPPSQDPLLPDAARVRAGLPVGPKGGRAAEERLLFRLAVGAATRAVVLSHARLGGGSGRELVPSHFLLRAAETVTGQRQSYASLATLPFVEQISGMAFGSSEPSDAWREADYDLAAARAALASGRGDELAYLRTLSPTVGSALRAERCRWVERRFTEYDGALRSPEALAAVATLLGGRQWDFAATALEGYARCPFGFFLQRVLGLRPLEEPQAARRLAALDRGNLIHDILFRAVRQARDAGTFPLDEEAVLNVARARLATFEQDVPPAAPAVWAHEREDVLLDVRRFVLAEKEDDSGFAPAHLEVSFGQRRARDDGEVGRDAGIAFDLGDLGSITVHGRIDRIDRHQEADLARVLDYKTGRASTRGADGFEGGTALQLPIYLLAAQAILGDDVTVASAAYRYVRANVDTSFSRETLEDHRDALTAVLAAIVGGIRTGCFFAGLDDAPCRNCDYAPVCGSGATRAAQRKRRDTAARPYLDMRETP